MLKRVDIIVAALLGAMALILAGNADASTIYADAHGTSRHFSTYKYNENNYGAGLTLENGNVSYSVGTYHNSVYRQSVYGAAGYSYPINSYIRIGAIAGVVTGYKSYPVPLILPKVSLGNGYARLNIMAAPEIPNVTPAVIMFSTQLKIGGD